jgi:G6PDH family F420-dependent oxidoreductase
MVQYGYKLSSEEESPQELVRLARAAEEHGFDFVSLSDHYHPWLDTQGHGSFAWSVLGAIAASTSTVRMVTGVTCPIIRYHPAIIAQAAATVQLLSGGRFDLGVGAGERLNEHVVGQGWPPVSVRHEMFSEALDIIALLWEGGYQSYRGRHLHLEDARVFDIPDVLPRICVAVSGPASIEVALAKGGGLFAVDPDASLVSMYREGGGDGPLFTEVPVCWAADTETAVQTAWEHQRWAVPGWKVMAELPNPVNFEAASATVRPDDIRELIACGPDVGRYVEAVAQFADAGFDHLTLLPIGDQDGFLRFWKSELQQALAAL